MGIMNNALSPDYLTHHKETLSKTILRKTKKDPLLHQFSSVYLNSLTEKSVIDETTSSLLTFIQQRFQSFLSIAQSSDTHNLSLKKSRSETEITIELVSSDAPYLIFTLEAIFKQFGLTITKMFHPLISIYKDKSQKIILIDSPKKDSHLVSACYIHCVHSDKITFEKELQKTINDHLNALQFVTQDTAAMLKNLTAVQKKVSSHPTPIKEFHTEWVQLLDWLANGNFSFFGYGEFSITYSPKRTTVTSIENEQLGVLNNEFLALSDNSLLSIVKKHVRHYATYRSPFLFDTLHYISPIKRFENLMHLSLKIPSGPNKWTEYTFLGLLKRSSLLAKNLETPIIKLKITKLFEKKKFWPGSHNYNQTIRFLNNVPKFELFRTPTESLHTTVEQLLSITNPNEVALFTRKKIDLTRLFIMVIIPNSQFSRENLELIIDYLSNDIPNKGVHHFSISGEQFHRIHLYLEQPQNPDYLPNIVQFEAHIRQLIRPWDLLLQDALIQEHGKKKGLGLYHLYNHAFPDHHKVRRSPEQTVSDIDFFEQTTQSRHPEFNLIPFDSKGSMLSGKAYLLLVYFHNKIDLFQFIPIFQNLKLYFFDELTTRVGELDTMMGYIHAFRIKSLDADSHPIQLNSLRPRLAALLQAVFTNKLPNDRLNGLVSLSSLKWKDIFVLQAYRNYLLQLSPSYTKEFIDTCLLKHGRFMEILIDYFQAKFSKVRSSKPREQTHQRLKTLRDHFMGSLIDVHNIDEDYLLKWLFNLVESTLRTNYFQHELEHSQLLVFKFDAQSVLAPPPKAFRELFVFSPDMEGIHIRFGPVSRGGIRWSNRPHDFRKEILGLATTQRVKNVVIVPNGSKGGFVIKKTLERSQQGVESKVQYEQFIHGLLSITDNRDSSDAIIKPEHVVCYDDDDPYLVVAADKGTAMFSDFANAISQSHNFWLDDAFASGGSTGYNHKELGITAKGAWECVKHHFLESGKDIMTTPFTVLGVGDMSGDVFGNGMLLSPAIKLVAAFNHLHIFIDPDPDPKLSFKERERLFLQEKSTWKEYKKSLISKGGGVFDRASKSIALSSEMQALCQTDQTEMNGEQLIHALLKCRAELLWLGGIGTYIKDDVQTHNAVGDIANNSVRIDQSHCHARVIGEGANLGITQSARLHLSEKNCQLNTDFIDNSAGVNISDYEVNLKIFLSKMLQQKKLSSLKQRNRLLASAASEVIDKVLANNISQHRLLSIEQLRSQKSFSRYVTQVNTFVSEGIINPKTDIIPSSSDFDRMERKKSPLPRPLLALLQSLIKLDVSEALSADPGLSHALFFPLFLSYFPKSLHQSFKENLQTHPLRQEITATLLTNSIVNYAGILFFPLLQEITEADLATIAITYYIMNSLFDCDAHRRALLKSSESFEENYQALITYQDRLRFSVLDALLMNHKLFTLDNIDHIKSAYADYEQHLTNLPIKTDTLHQTFHFIAYYNLKSSTNSASTDVLLTNIDSMRRFFKFDVILHLLNQAVLDNQWEVEEFKLLQKMLSTQKMTLLQKIVSPSEKNTVLTAADIPELFRSDLRSFKDHLTQIESTDAVSLSNLTVLINKLNLIK